MFGNFQIGDAALNMLKCRKEEPVRKINTISCTKDKALLSAIKDGYNESRMHDWIDKLESVTEPQKKWLTPSRRIVWLPYSYDKEHSCLLRSNERHLGIKQQ